MGVFDIGSTAGMQGASASIATALVPKKTAAQSLNGQGTPAALRANAASSSSTGSIAAAGTGSNQITSNDFLTLLVSELKNQDPTQPTDPNAYITQLVGVNSLQQLIQINKGIGTLDTSGTGSSPAAKVG